jgi:phosphoserine phosphatase RsbU/P
MATRRWLQGMDIFAPLGVLCAIVAIDAVLPASLVVSGVFGLAAIMASAITTTRRTAIVATASLAMGALSGVWNHNLGTVTWWMRLVTTSTLGVIAVLLARSRTRRERKLRHMTVIAEVVQRIVLPTLPSSIGSLRLAARYVSATEEALTGGDLYGVAQAGEAVRIIVGDSRGKGLDAVQMAATVLCAFRRVGVTESSLGAVVRDLDDVVSAVAGDEDFVTAVLTEFRPDGAVTVVNCGHHPPLFLSDDHTCGLMDTGEPVPPLGLHPVPSPVQSHLPEGSRLLLYTDGLIETRGRDGTFFPLKDNAAPLRAGNLDRALDGLLGQIVDHAAADKVEDDMALVLVERRTPREPGRFSTAHRHSRDSDR